MQINIIFCIKLLTHTHTYRSMYREGGTEHKNSTVTTQGGEREGGRGGREV